MAVIEGASLLTCTQVTFSTGSTVAKERIAIIYKFNV